MPSFDIVSKIDLQEVENGINQAKKEIENRFDFRGSKAELTWDKKIIVYKAPDDYKMGAIKDIIQSKLHRRGIDISSLKFSDIENIGGMMMKQEVTLKQGIDRETAKKISSKIRDSKIKVQSQINDDKLSVSSKSIDALQECMAFVKTQDFGQPLQFDNMRS
ncbi:MAG: YajQ family cyclic di-GMP-binding protein [Bdellovibrionales bacterium]|nr:YajQ family cyclic di-GMP-binding protein [Bdellovibrionales bacterium]